jgi:hypothetical protein
MRSEISERTFVGPPQLLGQARQTSRNSTGIGAGELEMGSILTTGSRAWAVILLVRDESESGDDIDYYRGLQTSTVIHHDMLFTITEASDHRLPKKINSIVIRKHNEPCLRCMAL